MEVRPDVAYRGHGVADKDVMGWLKGAADLGRAGKWRLKTERHPDVKPPQ